MAEIIVNTAPIGAFQTFQDTELDGVTYLVESAPSAGLIKRYAKSDHLYYTKDSTGTERAFVNVSSAQTLTNKTLTTPTIASFTNATHDHTNAVGGGTLSATAIASGTLALARGGTHADLSATGGANQFLKQSSSGADITVGTIASADIATALTTPGAIGSVTPAAGTFTTLAAGTTATAIPGNFYRDVNAGDSTNSVSVAIGNSGASQGYLLATYTNAAAAGAPTASLNFQPRNNAGSALGSVIASLVFTKTAAADTATATLFSTTGTLLLNASGQLVYTAASISTPAIISGSNAGSVVTQFKNTQAVSASNTTGFNGSVNSTTQARTAWQIDGGLSDTTDATRTATVTLTTCASGSFATTATWVGRNFTNNGSITATLSDAVTAAVTNVVTIGHDSSGTPAANYGTGTAVQGKSSTTAGQSMGDIQWIWTTATHASRKARGTLTAYDTAVRTCIQWEASGTAPMIGFLGTAPIVQTAAWTQTYTTSSHTTANPTATSVVTTGAALASYGYTQAQADDIVTELNRLITDVANAKNNINAIIDDIQAYGLFG